MRRGEVWWVTFASSIAGEAPKTRPAVIVSNDAANRHANRIQVVPLSSNTAKIYPCNARVQVDGRQSKAMADQLTTIAKERCTARLGTLSESDMRDVERAMRIQLGLLG